ncbi:MAG: alpha/beta fold hydrolase [Proteobacteria bacterium]|nr:alpha/beta fold hydrolase [Pseudomonadota bacterium]
MKTRTVKCSFRNSRGYTLDARLDLPSHYDTLIAPGSDTGNDEDNNISAFVIFCHCFTCSKETITTFRLSRLLAEKGYGILRFDFTGLGKSEGDFASTTFSTTQDDLRCAIRFLSEDYQAPAFLMGHSLGGTTALSIANDYDFIRGVVTVASPSEPNHVLHHFGHALTLLEQGIPASFNVAGTYFDIEPEFIEDVRTFEMQTVLSSLDKPVLIFNIENDALVDEDNALEIQRWVKGEASLIDITASDHLLSGRDKTEIVARDIIRWIEEVV